MFAVRPKNYSYATAPILTGRDTLEVLGHARVHGRSIGSILNIIRKGTAAMRPLSIGLPATSVATVDRKKHRRVRLAKLGHCILSLGYNMFTCAKRYCSFIGYSTH